MAASSHIVEKFILMWVKEKRQQVMERSLFRLEFQLPDGKDTLQTERRCYELKIQSFCKCYLQ